MLDAQTVQRTEGGGEVGMNIAPEMMAEDEQRWHARDVIAELGYCGNYMRDRKDMTNLDIRFYAYIMRKAHDMLKAQERPVRCAECRFYEKRGAPGGLGWCSRPGAGCGQPADFWCAGAKRKEEDGAETD